MTVCIYFNLCTHLMPLFDNVDTYSFIDIDTTLVYNTFVE